MNEQHEQNIENNARALMRAWNYIMRAKDGKKDHIQEAHPLKQGLKLKSGDKI